MQIVGIESFNLLWILVLDFVDFSSFQFYKPDEVFMNLEKVVFFIVLINDFSVWILWTALPICL